MVVPEWLYPIHPLSAASGPDRRRHLRMDQKTTTPRPSPAGPLSKRHSQLPGTSVPCPQAANPALTMPEAVLPAESGEDPYSPASDATRRRLPSAPASPADPLEQPLAFLGGATIALLTLFLPLASVMTQRPDVPSTSAIPALPALQSDGSEQPGRLSSSRAGASFGGDPRRQPQ
jgi:hypothetical protein